MKSRLRPLFTLPLPPALPLRGVARVLPAGVLTAILAVLPIATALAQSAAAPHPADAAASVPKAEHRSALSAYRRHAEAQPKSWREANDTVARIGGWRVYAREAAAASAPASGASR